MDRSCAGRPAGDPSTLRPDRLAFLGDAMFAHVELCGSRFGVVRREADEIEVVLAGRAGGSLEDGTPALEAGFEYLRGFSVDAAGNLVFADVDRVRIVEDGTIRAVAGGGLERLDHVPALRSKVRPYVLRHGPDGRLWIVESDGGLRIVH